MGDAGGKPGYQKADVRIAREGQACEVSSGHKYDVGNWTINHWQ